MLAGMKNLSVIPYVKNRLVFAELAARSIRSGDFDLVLVDLPYFLNGKEDVLMPARLFPLVSTLVIKNQHSRFINIPFVPNDAGCAALAVTEMMKARGNAIELQSIDDSQVINYRENLYYPDIALKDDYFVFTEGLENYFSGAWQKLDQFLKNCPGENRFYHEYRANQIVRQLRRFIKGGQRVLFLCEYRLWRLVSCLLEEGSHTISSQLSLPWSDLSAAIVFEDPIVCWAMGLLDDYPSIVSEFVRCIKNEQLFTFDKLQFLDERIRSAVSDPSCQPSFRKTQAFKQLLLNSMSANRCLVPHPVSHLYNASDSCLGTTSTKALVKQTLSYPGADKIKVFEFLKVLKEKLTAVDEIFEIPDIYERMSCDKHFTDFGCSDSFNLRKKIIDKYYPHLTDNEKNDLQERNDSIRWEIKADYDIHQTLSMKAFDVAERMALKKDTRIKKSWGSMAQGIHLKATIASRAKGENAFYVKQTKSNRHGRPGFTVASPTVFIFAADLTGHCSNHIYDPNSTEKKIQIGRSHLITDNDPEPDLVYSVFSTYTESTSLCDGNIDRIELSSLVSLHNRAWEVERYESINSLPKKHQCRIHPTSDAELSDFSLNEIGTAWAIKYARDNILLVSHENWKLTEKVKEYARAKSIKIERLPLSKFSDEIIERMRAFHFISTSLKRHPNGKNILRRFIP